MPTMTFFLLYLWTQQHVTEIVATLRTKEAATTPTYNPVLHRKKKAFDLLKACKFKGDNSVFTVDHSSPWVD